MLTCADLIKSGVNCPLLTNLRASYSLKLFIRDNGWKIRCGSIYLHWMNVGSNSYMKSLNFNK